MHRRIFSLAWMIFFFLLCDGIVGFYVPIAMTNNGLSQSQMGMIVSLSSLTGLMFDQILLRFVKQTHFRRLYLYMFAFALFLPLLIWKATSVTLFIASMAVWGVYYDLYNCGTMDFVGRFAKKEDHARSFGVLGVFIAMAYMLAPVIASALLPQIHTGLPFFLAYVALGIAFGFYLLLRNTKHTASLLPEQTQLLRKQDPVHFFGVVRILLPVLLVTALMNMIESMYWTVAPLIEHVGAASWSFGGALMFVHQLPMVFVGWFAGRLTAHRSKKRTAFMALFLGSLCFLGFFAFTNPYLLLLTGFLSSLLLSIVWPSINGVYADHLSQTPEHETQIGTAQDSFTNLGYIIGPTIGGFIAQVHGPLQTFAYVGVLGLILSIALFLFTPRHLVIHPRTS